MSLSSADINHLGKLARIAITEEEIPPTRDQLNGIFALIEQMQAVDTCGVAPMSHPQDLATRLRADAVSATDCREAFQRIAPQTENGLYLVPKVIE